jgi:hypothetical protein
MRIDGKENHQTNSNAAEKESSEDQETSKKSNASVNNFI